MFSSKNDNPGLYANYKYSLTPQQQSAIQVFLRTLPPKTQSSDAWALLHELTYTESWTEMPMFVVAE